MTAENIANLHNGFMYVDRDHKIHAVLFLARFSLHIKNNMLELKQNIILILERYCGNTKNNIPILK